MPMRVMSTRRTSPSLLRTLVVSLLLQVHHAMCLHLRQLQGKNESSLFPSSAPPTLEREKDSTQSDFSNEEKLRQFIVQWGSLVVLMLAFTAFVLFHYKHLIRHYCCARQETDDPQEDEINRSGTGRFRSYMTVRERAIILARIYPKSNRWRPEKQQRQHEQSATSDMQDDRVCCGICLAPFKSGVYILKGHTCQHTFHYSCCMEWLKKQHDECPYCRQDLFTTAEWRTAAVQVLGESRVSNMEVMTEEQATGTTNQVESTAPASANAASGSMEEEHQER